MLALLVALACGGERSRTIDDLLALRDRSDLSVVLILIDALRADRLGAYGYARATSPTIDALARSGIRFANATSQSSWTSSSMASLWTATYPTRNGIERLGQRLPEGATLAPEVLAAVGFRAEGLVRNPMAGAWLGLAQGFGGYRRPLQHGAVPLVRHTIWSTPQPGSDRDLTLDAIEAIRALAPGRYLLYLHYMDVHQYAHPAAEPGFGSSDSDLYDAAIAWVDRNVADLVHALDESGLRRRTIVVIASDHGEEFGEHGGKGHGKTLYREVVHVPLVIAPPFPLEPGVVVEEAVQNVDLWPTLLDLMGLPPMAGVDGRSLLPSIEAAARRPEAPPRGGPDALVFSEIDLRWPHRRRAPQRSLRVQSGEHALIWRETASQPEIELYDRGSDAAETRDLAADDADSVEALRRAASAHLAAPPMPWAKPDAERVPIGPPLREELRALGYVVE